MATPQKIQTTKDFVVIADIRDTIAILKDGSLRSVIDVSSMNFELKSADEQTAIIQAFQNFINSIDFPLQIGINSRKLDIGPYLKSLDALIANISNELMKIQAIEYTRFIKGLTELANIMSKKFYIVVPLHAVETMSQSGGTAKGLLGALKSMVSPSSFVKTLTDQELESYKIQLNQRVDFVMSGVSSLGLESKVLKKEELMNLYYSYYNPGHHL
jgi:hypothetical protein